MSTPTPRDTFEFAEHSPQNEAALAELTSAIAFGQGADTITLLLVRCNYGALRERMVAALVARLAAEALDGPVHTLRLAPQDSNLYAQVRAVAAAQRPGAVLVLGTEGVDALDVLLVEMNKRREEFRRDFPFPLVLWFTDDGYRQLSNYANDFESIAGGETIEFRLDQATLTQQLQGAAQRLFDALLAQDRPESFDDRLDGLDLGCLSPGEVEIALAGLQAQGVDLSPDLQASVAFAQGLNIPYEDAIALFDRSAAHWEGEPGEAAALKRGLALFYLGRARYFAADNEKYQTPDWLPAVAPLETVLEIFEQAQRPDLMAQGMIPLARVLHRLERWDDLEALIQRAIPLHEAHSGPDKLAQDYGFLADVALSRQHWPQAATLAQQALDRVPLDSWWRILYLKMLAQAVQAQGHLDAATEHLQAAQALGVMDHPKLYSDVLALLQQCLRAQGRYLEAFEVKRERLAVEQQYGLRAFIGAGRLRSRRTEQRATVRSERQSLEAIAPEIAASGRQQDLETLLQRIAGKEHKLIVLHGASGVGKSSLVNGGLLPALHARAMDNRVNVPVLIRQYTDWAGDLTQQLGAALEIQNAKFPIQNSEARSQEPETNSSLPSPQSPLPPSSPAPHHSPTLTPSHSSTQALRAGFANTPSYPSTLPLLRTCEDLTLRPVLIFDQFEEFFFANPDPVARQAFFEFLVACLELQPSALKLVLSLREDYIHYLLEARQAVRRLDLPEGSMARSQLGDILGKQILYEIGNFSPEDATAIIESLTAGSRLYLEPALVTALVADLAGPLGEVRPIEMQIVGAQLQTEGIQTLAQYRRLGDQPKETLVQRYLQDVVEDCGEEHRQLAELVLFLLTDERGTRPLKTRPELVRDLEALGIDWQLATAVPPLARGEGGISATASLAGEPVEANGRSGSPPSPPLTKGGTESIDSLDLVLKILGGSGIAVQLPDSPDDRYQLVHDYLAGVIRERQAPQLEALVAELEQEKQKRQEAESDKLVLTQANRKARRRLAWSSGLLAASLVASLLAGTFATASRSELREAEKRLEEVGEEVEVRSQEAIEATQAAQQATENAAAAQEKLDLAQASVVQAEASLQQLEQDKNASEQQIAAAQQRLDAAEAQVNEAEQARQNAEQASSAAQEQQLAASQRLSEAEQSLTEAEQAADAALAESELTRQGTVLERESNRILRRFNALKSPDRVGQLEQLLAATRTGQTLNTLLRPDTELVEYPALSPIYALEQILQGIRENNQFSHGDSVLSVAFSPDGQQILTGSLDGQATLWSRDGEQMAQFSHGAAVRSVAFSPDGQQILTGSGDGQATLWSRDGEQMAQFSHGDSVLSVAFSPDGQQILTGSWDGQATLWSRDGQQMAQFSHGAAVWSVAFSPDGQQILTGSGDGQATLWSRDGEQMAQFSHGDSVLSVAFSPDGQQILTGSWDGQATLWSRDGQQMAQFSHGAAVWSVAFSPDGQQILTGSGDGQATLWSRDGEQMAQFSHGDSVLSVAFSPDGQQILTGSGDGQATLWSRDGEQMAQFSHGDSVLSVAFSPDGQQILTGSLDGQATLRPVPTIEGLLARSCNWLRPYLTNNPDVSDADRALCNLPPLTP
jgi:hypothetical protein